jgi:hypothetical protein
MLPGEVTLHGGQMGARSLGDNIARSGGFALNQ